MRDRIIVSQDKGHLSSDELFPRTQLVTFSDERERERGVWMCDRKFHSRSRDDQIRVITSPSSWSLFILSFFSFY